MTIQHPRECDECHEGFMPSLLTEQPSGHLLCPDCQEKIDQWVDKAQEAARLESESAANNHRARRDQPAPAGAVTDLRQTLDAQLAILGELFDQAVAPNVTMRRKTQAVYQFRIALRFVRMLASKE